MGKRMGSFLDKVGLQHFVEKIKGLLSGYLPLSGGTMTGDIVYTDKATLNGNSLTYSMENNQSLKNLSLEASAISIGYRGNHDTYGFVQAGVAILNFDKLLITINGKTASLNTEKCEVQKFVLSTDSNQGLIANDSETVVKELSDDQVDKLLAGDTSVIDSSKYYVSGANLGRFAQSVAKDKSFTIIETNGIVKITTSNGEVTIPANVNYHIDEDYKITSGKNNIRILIQSGYVQNGNKYFDGLSNLSTIDVSKLNISNIRDLSYYFRGCSSLYELDSLGANHGVAYWNTKKVTNFSGMFTGCSSLRILKLNFWDTRNVSMMDTMFAGCTNLETLHLEGWDTQSVNLMISMFSGCSAITHLYLSEGFGRMNGSVGSLDLSALTKWNDSSIQTLLKLYNRKASGMGVITLKLSAATKSALGTSGIQTLTAKGYTIA
jgi:surface protein